MTELLIIGILLLGITLIGVPAMLIILAIVWLHDVSGT